MRVNISMKKMLLGKLKMGQAGEIMKWVMWAAEHEPRCHEYNELLIEPNDYGEVNVTIVTNDGNMTTRYKWFNGLFQSIEGWCIDVDEIGRNG